MKKNLTYLIILFAFGFLQTSYSQYIQVDESYNATQLLNKFFSNSGGCGTFSNVNISGGVFNGSQSYGYFTQNGSSFPFEDGIILSTGKASSAIGPNTGNISETLNNWGGDNDLEQALGLSNTLNATILEFDFTPFTNKISFDYIFSSEQYLSNPSPSQCGFTDGFAFLIKPKNTSNYQNIALVPGTNIPVSVNTIRGTGTVCPSNNTAYFDAFNGLNHPTTFNGQTKILKAESNVIAGTEYHIKLVIADQGNGLYDSAIFLGGGSFQSETNLGIDRTVANNNPYCYGESIELDASQFGIGNTYEWFKDGQSLNIFTDKYIISENTNNNEVEYSVEVMINGTCLSKGKVKIQFTPLPSLIPQSLTQCDNDTDGSAIFNLSQLDNSIKNNDTSLGNVSYFETITSNTPITKPDSYSSVSKTIYAEATNNYGCKSRTTVELIVNPITIIPYPYSKCDTDSNIDGFTEFDLNNEITNVIIPPPTVAYMTYHKSLQDALEVKNILSNLYTNSVKDQEIIYGRINNGLDCVAIYEITLTVNYIPQNNFNDETVILCQGESITLTFDNNYTDYEWSNGTLHSNQTSVSTSGTYTLEVTDANGCKAVKKFIVKPSAAATDIDALITEFSDSNSIEIIYTDNGGDYEFSIDGIIFQDSSIFSNVVAREYNISVRDKNGCLPSPNKKIYVLDYPEFFTPNNDGFNDTWYIKNSEFKNSIVSISIFNRFGKLLKFLPPNKGWDGNYLGIAQPADDYWFTIHFRDGNIIKSHFTLKR